MRLRAKPLRPARSILPSVGKSFENQPARRSAYLCLNLAGKASELVKFEGARN